MRFSKADNVLQLAMEMQAARSGLSLQDIQQRFGISRRTAMRMRDAVTRNFPTMEEVDTDERTKRWRIPPGALNRLVNFSAEELSAIQTSIHLMRSDNREDVAADLESTLTKLRALMRPEVANRIEPDLDALLVAEGLAMRPGPRPQIDTGLLDSLRMAIKACAKVKLRYKNRGTVSVRSRLVHPYGFLHGHRHYLVAINDHPQSPNDQFVMFSLANIKAVNVLDEYFDRDTAFSIQEFAERSFGVFQGEPFDVVWKFSPHAADEAAEFLFHPRQIVQRCADGSLIVNFRASGWLEMAWHLYCWGENVEVLEPDWLAKKVHRQRTRWPGVP